MAFAIPPEKAPGKKMVGLITAKNGLQEPSPYVFAAHSGPLHTLPHLVVAMTHYAILDPTSPFHRLQTLRSRVVKSLAQGHTASTRKGGITLGAFLWHFPETQEGMRACLEPLALEAWVQGHLDV